MARPKPPPYPKPPRPPAEPPRPQPGTSSLCPALIDPPGRWAVVEEWLAYRDELARSGIPNIAPFVREADMMIARLRRGER